jgi:hypothetical protein
VYTVGEKAQHKPAAKHSKAEIRNTLFKPAPALVSRAPLLQAPAVLSVQICGHGLGFSLSLHGRFCHYLGGEKTAKLASL